MNTSSTLSLILSLCTALVSCQEKQRRPDLYLIPEGYVGWVRVDYGIEGAPALPVEGGYHVIKIPAGGRAQTSTEFEEGWAKDQYRYYSDSGAPTRSLHETLWGEGGMIHAGSVGSVQGKHNYRMCFFVGTEQQLKEFGWETQDRMCDPSL